MKFRWPPEWRDPDAMSYFISDFASAHVKPSRKLAFWSSLICEVCLYRKSPFVTFEELKRCLAWRGNAPHCLGGVLDDMLAKHTVVSRDKLTETWSQWGLGLLASPISSMWHKLVPHSTEKKFVVVSVLEDCTVKLMTHIHDNSVTLLYTAREWDALVSQFVHPSNKENFSTYLIFQRFITTHGDPVSLVKVKAKNEKTVSKISQVDEAIGVARSTQHMLECRINHLSEKVSDFHNAAVAAMSSNKAQALVNLRRKKMYEKSLRNQEGALNNTESLLLQLQESQQHHVVLSTLKVGADALQQNKVSLSVVDNIMDQLQEYKEYEEEVSTALSSDTSCDDESLNEELAKLLADNTNSPPSKKMLITPDFIDLTEEDEQHGNHLSELIEIETELSRCPAPPTAGSRDLPTHVAQTRDPQTRDSGTCDSGGGEFDDEEHSVETETTPKRVTAKLSPELRRKPGRKLVGHLAPS